MYQYDIACFLNNDHMLRTPNCTLSSVRGILCARNFSYKNLADFPSGTSIRLPIGYFTLGPAYCNNTPFEKYADVYVNAWSAVKDLVQRCCSRGIGVLLDMHALPGGANGGDHSGTNSGKPELWGSRKNLDLATRSLLFLAHEAKGLGGVIGIQIVNESEYNAKGK